LSIRKPGLAVFTLCLTLFPGSAVPQEGSPAGTVPKELLEARRQRLLEALDGAPAILSSAGPRGDHAQDSDYREDDDFFYLTGLEAPGAWLVLNAGDREGAVLYLPPRSAAAERWTGPQLGPGDEARTLTGLSEIQATTELEGDLQRWFNGQGEGVKTAPDTLLASFGDARFDEVLASYFPEGSTRFRPLAPILAPLRLVKDREEVRRIRRAVEITAEAHLELWRVAKPGISEYELEAALEYVFRVQGAERVGFPSIVGSGPNSVVLHYDKNRRSTEAGDLVVVDIGAEFGYYTADLTRTFPVNGSFSPRQKALYDLVLGAWDAGLEAIRPGAQIADVNQAVRGYLESHSGDLCGEPSCAPFLIHGVSHWLGMDVHDVGGNRSPFTPGMILTLEPGLYLPEEALGIRVEDDILVTESGHEVLSRDLPRTTEEIEAIMGEEPMWVRGLSAAERRR
jgi:Xaa-Pro aminopeptidase